MARHADAYPGPPPPPPAAAPSGNLVAVSALIAMMLAIGLVVVAGMSLAPHAEELAEVAKAAQTKDRQATMEAMERLMNQHGGTPPWLLHFSVLLMGALFAWLAGLVCGLLGLRRKRRRGLAIAALVIGGLIPVFVCCGGAM